MSSGRHNGLRTLALAGHAVASRRMGNGPGTAIAQASHPLLKLQRLVGNRAVESALLRRQLGVLRREGDKEHSNPALLASITLSRKGKVKGGSKHAGYEGAIELTSFQIAGAKTIGPQGGAGGEDKERSSMDFSIGKFMDDSSPILIEAAANGEHLTEVKFEWVKADEKGNLSTYHSMEFSDGILTGYQTGGGGEARPSEQFFMSLRPKK